MNGIALNICIIHFYMFWAFSRWKNCACTGLSDLKLKPFIIWTWNCIPVCTLRNENKDVHQQFFFSFHRNKHEQYKKMHLISVFAAFFCDNFLFIALLQAFFISACCLLLIFFILTLHFLHAYQYVLMAGRKWTFFMNRKQHIMFWIC